MTREEFLKTYLARKSSRVDAERVAACLRAMRVQQTHVENLHEVIVPGMAWIVTAVALIWMWAALDVHRLVWIVLAHLIFRFFVRGYMNVVLIPKMFRRLAVRFPEFEDEIEGAIEAEASGEP